MRTRRALAVAGAAVGSAIGAVALRRRSARSRDRVELYFEDGSLVTIAQGAPGADPLLLHARELLAAAQS
jgi:hypothetical protein